MDDNVTIQGLWIGSRLSTMERLSIASYLAHGHAMHLYVYDELLDAPKGVELRDGNEILPKSRIFRYSGSGSLAGFSNYFRYKLLLEKGGWWTDLDTICLRHFDFPEPYVFSSEAGARGEEIDAAVIKAPRGSPLAEYAFGVCETKDPTKLAWSEVGPKLLAESVDRNGLRQYVRSARTFCPYPWDQWETALSAREGSRFDLDRPTESYAVHLFNEGWRRSGRDKDASYPPECLYERLKSKYFVTAPPAAAIARRGAASPRPTVSVIMPCWNGNRSIADAIRSVLAQTFSDFELIVVNNGSNESARDVAALFGDSRVRCLRGEPHGISVALNAGLAAANGRYVARLDGDDMWLPEMLETQVYLLDAHPDVGLVYGRSQIADDHWNPLPSNFGYPLLFPDDALRSMLSADTTCNQTWVCRRECFERAGVFDEDLESSEDLDMWLRIARHYRFAFTDCTLARIRRPGGSLIDGRSFDGGEQGASRRRVFDKLYAVRDLPAEIVAMKPFVYSNMHVLNGLLCLRQGEYRQAFRDWWQALRISSSRGYTLTRIAWTTLKWQVLGQFSAGRHFAARVAAANPWKS